MNKSTSTDNQSFRHDRGNVSQPVESFVNDVLQCLSKSEAPESAVSDVRESGEELVSFVDQQQQQARETAQRADELEDKLSETQERVDELEAELADNRADNRRELAQVRSRVTSVEDDMNSVESPDGDSVQPDSGDDTPTPQAGSSPTQSPETPLEEVTRLPEHMAESELTANAGRARAVFRDVLDYTESVPKGRAIATPDLRRVLTALRDNGTACYKTVSRVVDFLTELGGDDVWTTERMNGDTVVVFSKEICRRRAAQQNATDGVVTGQRVAD